MDTTTTPMLSKSVEARKLVPGKSITHWFALGEIMKAYDTFSHAAEKKALKVILINSP